MEDKNRLDVEAQYQDNPTRRYQFSHQRIHSGFCDGDWWDMDSYLLELLPAMLNRMADKTISYPGTEEFPTMESWQAWLRETANYFILARQYQEDMWLQPGLSLNTIQEYSNKAQECVSTGLERISKYFFDLWD